MGILSIRRSMDSIGEERVRAEASLGAFNKVLLALQRTAVAISGEENPVFEERLKSIRSELTPDPAAATITQTGEAVARELDEFAEQRTYVRDKKDWALKQVTGIVARIIAATAENGSVQVKELAELANRIDSVSRLESLSEVREQLVMRIEEIHSVADRVQLQAKAHAQAIEGELGRVKNRLAELEQISETDPVTGLGNRRMGENSIRAEIASKSPLSIILLDLDGFKAINDTYGHRQGDQVLQLMARELKKSVRESDVVCRWGGDEFVIVLRNATREVAEMKAAAIKRNAFGEFLVDGGGKVYRIRVSGSLGVAEYRSGEDAFEFLERADQLMYAEKSRRGKPLYTVA